MTRKHICGVERMGGSPNVGSLVPYVSSSIIVLVAHLAIGQPFGHSSFFWIHAFRLHSFFLIISITCPKIILSIQFLNHFFFLFQIFITCPKIIFPILYEIIIFCQAHVWFLETIKEKKKNYLKIIFSYLYIIKSKKKI